VTKAAVAAVVPVYNEESMVGPVVRALRDVFGLVVCVDDGSHDASADQARSNGAVVLRHAVNLGQGAALQTGFDYVRTRTSVRHVVTFDADGQHRVADALSMVRRARETGVDVLLGTRRGAHGGGAGAGAARRLVLRAGVAFSRWNSGLELSDTHNGLRVLNRRALDAIRLHHSGMAHASELESLILRHRLTWAEHEVTIDYTDYSRSKGQSNLNAFNIVYDLLVARLGVSS
jgi:glycosyltransferase involved in cell wall biosynthesis